MYQFLWMDVIIMYTKQILIKKKKDDLLSPSPNQNKTLNEMYSKSEKHSLFITEYEG